MSDAGESGWSDIDDAVRSAIDAGRGVTAPVDVARAVADGNHRVAVRRRLRRGASLTGVLALTLGVMVPVLVARGPKHDDVAIGPPGTCESSWLNLAEWQESPSVLSGPESPTLVPTIVRVDSAGHSCLLPAGWLKLTSIHRPGTPFASIAQTDAGHAVSVALSAGTFAVADVALTIPWPIPSGNLCLTSVTVGVSPPGSPRTFSTILPASCAIGSVGTLQASVGPFRQINSGVPHASGDLVADLDPGPMTFGPGGILYISEPSLNQVVARLPDGSFKLIAGTGQKGYSGDGGPATKATLSQPEGLAAGPDGVLYIADFGNNRVREVLANGTITTVAGDGGHIPRTIPIDGIGGGPALGTNLWSPSALAIGPRGSLYIAATNENSVVELQRGQLRTVVSGNDLGVLYSAERSRLCGPAGLARDASGDTYFDCSYGGVLMMVTPSGQVVLRAISHSGGFSSLSAAGDDSVVELTTISGYPDPAIDSSGLVTLTPTSRHTTDLPTDLPSTGIFSPSGIAADGHGSVVVDQSGGGIFFDGGPPAIVVVRDGKVSTLWAADA